MNLKTCILTNNDCYKAGRTIVPRGVMVHSTGANNPNLKRYVQPDDGILGVNANRNDWNRPGVAKCTHAFIGKGKDGSVYTYQTLPWNHRGWHAGAGANNTHIAFEICEDGLADGEYFAKVYREAVELTAMMCKMFGLDPLAEGVVICHSEGADMGIASGHADVMHWFPKHGKDMDDFRADVAEEMAEKKPTEPPYETVDEVPEWGRATVQKLVDRGILRGDGDGLGITYDLLRTLVILDRAGVFDE